MIHGPQEHEENKLIKRKKKKKSLPPPILNTQPFQLYSNKSKNTKT